MLCVVLCGVAKEPGSNGRDDVQRIGQLSLFIPRKNHLVIQINSEFSGLSLFVEFYCQIPPCLFNQIGQTGRYWVLASGGAKLNSHLHYQTPFSLWVMLSADRRLFAGDGIPVLVHGSVQRGSGHVRAMHFFFRQTIQSRGYSLVI